jgi:hypothetical protein
MHYTPPQTQISGGLPMTNSPFFFIRVLILIGLSALTLNAQSDDKTVWKDFRKVYPYHIQTLALTGPDSEGRRTLIISEPPPDITIERLRTLNPAALQNATTYKHGIGYDGWVKDVVVSLPAMSPPELSSLVDSLHHELFGTAYKATVIPLPTETPNAPKANLDLRVPTRELGTWILGPETAKATGGTILAGILFGAICLWSLWTLVRRDRRWWRWTIAAISFVALYLLFFDGNDSSATRKQRLSFSSVVGGDSSTGREILDRKISGVFFSDQPGVVLWAFPRKMELNAQRVNARQFALDSDIVIGAIASDDHVVVLGRERSLSVAGLPPLRTETIVQLAAANTDELAQSYERNDIFAGKFDGARDWAPIYLSQTLVDTEYGSLLNITDQLLKSWSMHGLVRYINFKYADPPEFPFPSPLSEYAHTNRVTFNWNTKGTGYTAKDSAYEIFALNRTGALPVDYLGSDNNQLQQAEEKAYGYFAGLSDPNLVRVVQYAALYQIFRRFGVTAQSSPAVGPLHAPTSYSQPLAALIDRVASLSDAKIEEFTANLRAHSAPQALIDELRELASIRDQIHWLKENGGPESEKRLIESISAPRLAMMKSRGRSDSQRTYFDRRTQSLAVEFGKHKSLLLLFSRIDLDSIRQAYVSESHRIPKAWIRTPSIVLSWIEGDLGESATGGHNLDSRITLFRPDAELSSGEIKVIEENGSNVILHSPQDKDKVTELVRVAGRNEDKSASEIESILKQKLPEVQVADRSMSEALGFNADVHPSSTRGYHEIRESPGVGNTGWKLTRQPISDRQNGILTALSDRRTRAIVVSRQEGGNYLIAHSRSHQLVESTDLPSAIDAVTSCIGAEIQGDSKVTVYLAGFEPRQGRGFAHSLEMNLPEGERPNIAAAIEGDSISPEQLSGALKEEYDFARARVSVTQSAETDAIDVNLEVPAKRPAKPPLLVRLKIWLDRGVAASAELLQSVQGVIGRWQQALAGASEDINLIFAHRALLHDLQRVNPGIKSIEINYSREGKDILHADNQNPRGRFESDRSIG